jgi:putative ABC transport system permease protein
MLTNYLKVALRTMRRYLAFTCINVFGLAVAMSVCLLVMLMLADQKSYDGFHARKDRLYRILGDANHAKAPSAATPFPLAGALRTGYAGFDGVTQLTRGVGGEAVYGGKTARLRGYFADTSFLQLFDYPLARGDRRTALAAPNTMILGSERARQLFGNADPLGKTVRFTDRELPMLGEGTGGKPTDWGLFTVTGVVAPTNHKTHLPFEVLLSAASLPALVREGKREDVAGRWGHNACYTYVLLGPGQAEDDLAAALRDLVARRKETLRELKGFTLLGQPLTAITPGVLVRNEPSHSLPRVAYYFLGVLGLLIMLSACLNYTNLSVARALTRAKEIGVRKVAGARRRDVVYQFLAESTLTSLFALGLAMGLLLVLKPAFKGLWLNEYLDFQLRGNAGVYAAFAGFAVLTGLLAGWYPALRLSAFQPLRAMKHAGGVRPGRIGLRKALNVVQLVVSLFFITTATLVYRQFRHFMAFEYGFRTGHIVNVPLQGNDYRKVAAALGAVPGVAAVSACEYLPATNVQNGMSVKPAGSKDEYRPVTVLGADEHFARTFGLRLLAGKPLPPGKDLANRFVLVNRAAVKALGYAHPAGLVGQVLRVEGSTTELEVIGVVADFTFRTPFGGTNEVGPLVLRNEPRSFAYVNVQLVPGNPGEALARLAGAWPAVDPLHPFAGTFYDAQLAATNGALFDLAAVLGVLAFLAVAVALLGMLGMAAYTVERRTREVALRKVLGATDWGIARLLSGGFLRVLAVSVGVGAPLSYVVNGLWLRHFPNRVTFGVADLLPGAAVLLLLGVLTIGSQTWKGARTRPVDAIRNE